MRILIVEDDKVQSTGLKINLSLLGYHNVTVVNDVLAQQSVFSSHSFDLVFCDIRMPNVDGIALLSEYLDPQRIKGVVIMSAVEDSILQLAKGMCSLLAYPFVEVLPKPFDELRLAEIMTLFTDTTPSEQFNNTTPVITTTEVTEAMFEDRVFVYYQPQFEFRTGKLIGVEALVRLDHPEHGIVKPIEFLGAVSALGLMEQLFVLVLEKATSALVNIGVDIQLSVNINQHLLQNNLCDLTLLICQKNGFPTERLTLEVTEEEAYNSTPQALANLARLRLNGVQLSIDDFGTGYASLEQLVDLPFTELKIDRVFISRIKEDYRLQQIANMTLNMAQALGLNCVAEGVEDKETWEYLKEIGVDVCQGFYTGRPMTIHEMNSLYKFISAKELADVTHFVENSVVLVDKQTERGKALAKLLEKELSSAFVTLVHSKDSMLAKLRDLPVQTLILDGLMFAELSNKERQWIVTNGVTQGYRVLVLNSMDEGVELSNSVTSILKSNVMSEVVRQISKACSSFDNNGLSNPIEILSDRELVIAKLLVAGFTNKYISYELGISQKTVSTFKTRVLSKLGLKSTLELSKFMAQQGS